MEHNDSESPKSFSSSVTGNNSKGASETPRKEKSFLELGKFVLIALLIVIPVRLFVAQPFVVSGASMVPTFQDGEYLIVDELSYRFEKPERGDVIIFRYPNDPSKFFIKRVIGLPGETVNVEGNVVTVKAVGEKDFRTLEEPYVKSLSYSNNHTELKTGEYFVMGDNRGSSLDSRAWGPLPDSFIKGRPFIRLLPVTRLGIFPGQFSL